MIIDILTEKLNEVLNYDIFWYDASKTVSVSALLIIITTTEFGILIKKKATAKRI